MWVEIKSEVFEDGQNIFELRKLIQDLCYKHKYEVFIDLPNVYGLSIFQGIYDDIKEIIDDYYNRYTIESALIDCFVCNDVSDISFTVTEAITFFNLPLIVLLENSDNDGYFLDAIIREFKKSSKKVQRFKDNHWLNYGNAGGSGGVKHFIERIKKEFNGEIKFLKCIVILDSDLEYSQIPNPKRTEIENYLFENNITFHCLEKREIENYLPDDIFESIESNDEFIKTYLRKLTSIQKDFIDIENGFGMDGKALEKSKPLVYNLFLNENENQKENTIKINNLRKGIKDKFDNYKNDFPKLFEKATQEGLIERTKDQNNPNELKEILNKINKLL
jgi:hypothetical protein